MASILLSNQAMKLVRARAASVPTSRAVETDSVTRTVTLLVCCLNISSCRPRTHCKGN